MAAHAGAELGLQRRPFGPAALLHEAAARIEDAAGRPVGDAGHDAGNGVQALAAGALRQAPRAAPRYRGGAAARTAARPVCSSTCWLAYITITRWAVSATTPMSWVISTSAMLRSLLQRHQQVQDLRLDGDVERGGRLVGDQQLRIAGDRHGDHDALAHAAGQLMREAVQARGGGRDADFFQQFDGAPLALAARAALMQRSISMIWKPTVKHGLRLVIGSWKIIAMSLPTIWRRARRRASAGPCRRSA